MTTIERITSLEKQLEEALHAIIVAEEKVRTYDFEASKLRYDWTKFEVSIPSLTRRWGGTVFTVYTKKPNSLTVLSGLADKLREIE